MIERNRQAIAVAFSFQEHDDSRNRDKVFSEINIANLKMRMASKRLRLKVISQKI